MQKNRVDHHHKKGGKSMLKEVCAGRVAKLPRLLVPFFPSQPAKTKKSDD